jgi:hypothetical protein
MTTPSEPTPPPPAPETHPPSPVSYWLPPSPGPDYQLLPRLRARLVALVAALVVQATMALLGVLPALPVAHVVPDPDMYYMSTSEPTTFWVQFAAIEFIAAVVISLAFGPGVRFGDVPAIGRLVLGLGFVVMPAAAIVLGGIDAARAAAAHSAAVAASSWLTSAVFGMLFFGLPLIALIAPVRRALATQ